MRKKIANNKSVLVNRILRIIENGQDSDGSGTEWLDTDARVPNCNSVNNWEKLERSHNHPLRDKAIENYYLYRKHPLGQDKINCRRQLSKSKKFC